MRNLFNNFQIPIQLFKNSVCGMDTGGGHTNGGHVEITAKDIKKHISEANIRKTGTLMLNGLQLTAIPVELIGKCAPYVHSFTIIHNNITHIPKGILPQFTKLRYTHQRLTYCDDLLQLSAWT